MSPMILADWKKYVLDRSLGHDVDDLDPTVNAIFQLIINGDKIDMSGLPLDQVNPVHLCVALRATYSCHEEVVGWFDALRVCRDACIRDGIGTADDALYGFDQELKLIEGT